MRGALLACILLAWPSRTSVVDGVHLPGVAIASTSSVTVDPATSREYIMVTSGKLSLRKCEQWCRAIDASLPCVRSRHEDEFLSDWTEHEWFWLGRYQAGLCAWDAVSDCSSDYENWAPDQPGNKNNRENCVISGGERGWFDKRCSIPWPRCVCERGLNTSLAFLQWKGPKLQFGIQGRRSTNRDAAYALAIAGQLLWAQRKLDDREIDEDARALASKAADEDESDEEDESLRNPIVAQRYGSTAPPSRAF